MSTEIDRIESGKVRCSPYHQIIFGIHGHCVLQDKLTFYKTFLFWLG